MEMALGLGFPFRIPTWPLACPPLFHSALGTLSPVEFEAQSGYELWPLFWGKPNIRPGTVSDFDNFIQRRKQQIIEIS
jgi:hypothetical protein